MNYFSLDSLILLEKKTNKCVSYSAKDTVTLEFNAYQIKIESNSIKDVTYDWFGWYGWFPAFDLIREFHCSLK